MRPDTAPSTPAATRLADYAPPAWLVDTVRLTVDLAPEATRVHAVLEIRKNPARPGPADLRLDGRALTFLGAHLDGSPLAPEDVTLDTEGLTVPAARLPGEAFTWTCETEIDPAANTALEGLFLSQGMYCTQCEAEGFRKITYYPDRPDVMARFSVRIEAPADIPVLLSNGNPGASGPLPEGRHFAEWDDPWPKPAYLFALVAGDLRAREDRFTTRSGREVALKLWVRPGDEGKTSYAMDALKRSMLWDERTHGLEYDLDLFQIVAVDDFNMGAMENKGLNIFNAKYVLASPDTATDTDYERIESVVAHEYFHNWTGNRITCRDWFQLCLKEGLTVYRDQLFSADERSAPVQRIADVKALRARQFPEDAGPLAHPVRPETYIEINNFYTATVYEKGAEVIRMLTALVGPEGYRRAIDLYVARHDGTAATVEEFRACFEDACGVDLSGFALWWSQAGTPRLTAEEVWDGARLRLTLSQETPPTPGQDTKAPLVIPVELGAFGAEGAPLGDRTTLVLDRAQRSWDLAEGPDGWAWRPADGTPLTPKDGGPVLSLLGGFSAPVILERRLSDAARAHLLAHDTDPVARWEVGHQYAVAVALGRLEGAEIPEAWTGALATLVADRGLDPAFRAYALGVPSDDEIAGALADRGRLADPEAIGLALQEMAAALGGRLAPLLAELRTEMARPGPYRPDAESAGRRALANRCLGLRVAAGLGDAEAEAQADTADNMTDRIAALGALVRHARPGAASRLAAFYDRWQEERQVIDTWFALQATAPVPDALARVRRLAEHPAFSWKTPNRFRSLVGAFAAGNPRAFHAADGAGYRFVADWLLTLDPVNPQTTARLAGVFETWRRYTEDRQALMKAELARLAATETLSRNTREIVERLLR